MSETPTRALRLRCAYHMVLAAVGFGLAQYHWVFGLAGAFSLVAAFACALGADSGNQTGS